MATKIEESIRAYLESLTAKPSAAKRVDRSAIKALREQLKAATDPIARLDLARELREASTPKQEEPAPHPGLDVFLAEGKRWAEEHGYTAADLQRYAKVPAEVLREAGFVVPASRERTSASRTRAPRLDPELDVLQVARNLPQPFRLRELAARIDRDAATTRNYATKLVASGLLTTDGVDASGRGKPATLYRVT